MLTPQPSAPKLSDAIGLNQPLYIKREDLHPFGSHKGRSIPPMIDTYVNQGIRDFVISSSGNAALAAARYVSNKPNLKLTIFIGKNIDNEKLSVILSEAKNPLKRSLRDPCATAEALDGTRSATPQDDNDKRVIVEQVSNPKQSAFQMDKSGKTKNLRQSTDDLALAGYEELASELAGIGNLSAVFIPTSSGTTAQGLYEGFKKLGINPQIHIVQTDVCHPLVGHGTRDMGRGKISLASAIVDQVGHRKKHVAELLKASNGAGWVATNDEITNVMKLVEQTQNIIISPNSALSVVGLMQAIQAGRKFSGPVVCLLTGL